MRRCYWCKKVKSLSEFYKNKCRPAGYDYLCKICTPIKNKKSRWRLRFELLKNADFTCYYCGRKPPEVSLEIDHKFPKSKGGKNIKDNYQVLCKECNLGKGDSILNEFNS